MSRFRKLTQTIWHCQYHIVWVPKYRYRVLTDQIATEAENCIRAFSEQKECEIVELNVQIDHVHLLVLVPPKISISDYVGNKRKDIILFRPGSHKSNWQRVACRQETTHLKKAHLA